MENARRSEVEILYEGKNITTPVNEYLKNISYTDMASMESDRIEINMHDINRQWIDAWMPEKGNRIRPYFRLINWKEFGTTDVLECGEFEVDDMSYSGRPTIVKIGAVSIPSNEAFHAQTRTKVWEAVTIRQIAEEIAGRAGIAVYYEAEDINLEITEQNEETDCQFLYAVCKDYGLAMKVYANKIIIFDEELYENKASIRTIDETDMIGWEYNSTVAGTYTGADVRYTDPNTEEEYEIRIGGGNRILEINESTDNIKDAERKGTAKLNNENKKAVTMGCTIMADVRIAASSCVDITGLGGKIDGKYYIDKAVTSKGAKASCQTKLEMHKVTKRIKSVSIGAVKQAEENNSAGGTAYTVVAGDTLWKIAKQYMGSGIQYEKIYAANKETIENTAKERGKKDSGNGHWIFAGTVLHIPAGEQENG